MVDVVVTVTSPRCRSPPRGNGTLHPTPPSSSGLGLRPFTPAARVRIPLGVLNHDNGVRHLAGREDELAVLVDLLDAPADALAAAVVVGEAGIGKTTLWLAATAAAEARGALVLSSRPSEAEARFSFVGLADLIGDVVVDLLPELPRPQRRALEAALALSDAGRRGS